MRLRVQLEADDLVVQVVDEQHLRCACCGTCEQDARADLFAGAVEGIEAIALLGLHGPASAGVWFGRDDGEVSVQLSGAACEAVRDVREWLDGPAGFETNGDSAGSAADVVM